MSSRGLSSRSFSAEKEFLYVVCMFFFCIFLDNCCIFCMFFCISFGCFLYVFRFFSAKANAVVRSVPSRDLLPPKTTHESGGDRTQTIYRKYLVWVELPTPIGIQLPSEKVLKLLKKTKISS